MPLSPELLKFILGVSQSGDQALNDISNAAGKAALKHATGGGNGGNSTSTPAMRANAMRSQPDLGNMGGYGNAPGPEVPVASNAAGGIQTLPLAALQAGRSDAIAGRPMDYVNMLTAGQTGKEGMAPPSPAQNQPGFVGPPTPADYNPQIGAYDQGLLQFQDALDQYVKSADVRAASVPTLFRGPIGNLIMGRFAPSLVPGYEDAMNAPAQARQQTALLNLQAQSQAIKDRGEIERQQGERSDRAFLERRRKTYSDLADKYKNNPNSSPLDIANDWLSAAFGGGGPEEINMAVSNRDKALQYAEFGREANKLDIEKLKGEIEEGKARTEASKASAARDRAAVTNLDNETFTRLFLPLAAVAPGALPSIYNLAMNWKQVDPEDLQLIGDAASSIIDEKYLKGKTGKFSEDQLNNELLKSHNAMLDSMGRIAKMGLDKDTTDLYTGLIQQTGTVYQDALRDEIDAIHQKRAGSLTDLTGQAAPTGTEPNFAMRVLAGMENDKRAQGLQDLQNRLGRGVTNADIDAYIRQNYSNTGGGGGNPFSNLINSIFNPGTVAPPSLPPTNLGTVPQAPAFSIDDIVNNLISNAPAIARMRALQGRRDRNEAAAAPSDAESASEAERLRQEANRRRGVK